VSNEKRPRAIRLTPSGTGMPRIRAIGQHWAPYEDFYHTVLGWPWVGFFLFVAVCFVAVNLFFAVIYAGMPGAIANMREHSVEDGFYFSVQTMATIGYGGMMPVTRAGHAVVTIEAIVGILSVAIVTGVTFSKFSRPTARVLFSDKLVVSHRDGEPHLLFRMANWRHNQVVEANLRVIVLVTKTTREGDMMRIPVEVPLVRKSTALFSLTWTAMHRIDEQSPFYGPDALERLKAVNAEIFLSLNGLDATIAQTIYAGRRYVPEDIVWHARYADVLFYKADGTRVINYRHFHDVVMEEPVAADGRTG
jgi:inward rectifier potassium channel